MPRGRPRRRGRPGQDRDGDEAGDLATSPGSPARNARDRAGHPPSYGDVVTMLATTALPITNSLLGTRQGPGERLLSGSRGGFITAATLRDSTGWDRLVADPLAARLVRHGPRHTAHTALT